MRLKEYRTKRDNTDYGVEERINDILYKFNIKREVWYGEKIMEVIVVD